MSSSGPKSLPTLGFLTICQHPSQGMVGGYLLLAGSGRPMEFHCTAPVRPNRAQQILYGPTLDPYLHGEQIGQALVAQVQSQPAFVLTDVATVLATRAFSPIPVVWLRDREQTRSADPVGEAGRPPPEPADSGQRTASSGCGPICPFSLEGHQVAVLASHPGDQQTVLQRWAEFSDQIDPHEPFARIREAIAEAQRGAA